MPTAWPDSTFTMSSSPAATIAPLGTFERKIAWVSSDLAVAEVRSIGEQIAVVAGRKPGTCIVTAASDKAKRSCAVTVTDSTLPAGWSYDELSAPPIPGAVALTDGKFTLTGCGHAMNAFWQRVKDQGVFISKSVTGDVEISARLTGLAPNVGGPNAYQWDNRPATASGLMIRESLTEGCSRYLLIQVEASGQIVCRWRDKSGDQDGGKKKELGKVTLPVHLKLVRTGREIQVLASTDGQNWGAPLMSHTAAFEAGGRAGLFVCSGNTFATTTAEFDSVRMGPAGSAGSTLER